MNSEQTDDSLSEALPDPEQQADSAQQADSEQQADTGPQHASDGSSHEASHQAGEEVPVRRGNVEQCPVCGSNVSPEAYHCATCHSFFCFHCRARLLEPDTKLQCVNQQCKYYGKLVCSVCDERAEKDEPPVVYSEPVDGYWPAWLVLVLIASGVVWHRESFQVAALFALIAFFAGGFLLQQMGFNVFGTEREVTHHRKTRYYTCLCCKQPVKELPRA